MRLPLLAAHEHVEGDGEGRAHTTTEQGQDK
jgi:hypothetical protein